MTSTERPRASRTVAVLCALIIVILALHLLGSAGLRGPTGFTRQELNTWLDDPIAASATVARWFALVLSYYLAAIVVTVAALGPRLDTSPVRHVIPTPLSGLAGVILGVSAVAIPLSMHMVQTDNPLGIEPTDQLRLQPLDEPLTLTPTAPAATAPQRGSDDFSPESRRALTFGRQPETWTVAPGDSFWSIAQEHLADAWERSDLTDQEIARYWRTLIDANIDRLVEPGNPDLLLPNQELLLPTTPPVRG